MLILVTGGVRSGKSRHAESLLDRNQPATYLAPGALANADADPDWAARVAAHQAARPAGWTTVETHDVAAALATAEPVLVDCLGTWLTALMDDRDLWDAPIEPVQQIVNSECDQIVRMLGQRDQGVLVTNEVGLGVVPEHRSGRMFRDMLGTVNQRVAAACDHVHLVVAGRVLVL